MSKWKQLSQACRDEKVFGRFLGIFFILFGLFFVVIGVTIIPIFGFIVAIPLLLLGFYYFKKSPGEDDVCEIDTDRNR